MQYGLDVPTTGAYADPNVLAQLAAEAEAAGWDGFFIWDVLFNQHEPSTPSVDPWIALTAIALGTTRIKIGLMVTPLARHRPWMVARQLANLDQLSQGRMVCTVGIGHSATDFAAVGEGSDPLQRAQLLDESLEIINGLWTQDHYSFRGTYYQLQDVTLYPKPLQSPRIPIWVAGGWPRQAPFRRAARWDGVSFKSVAHEQQRWLTLNEFRAGVAFVQQQRTQVGPFEVLMSGELPEQPTEALAQIEAFAAAGATWWVEEGFGWSLDEFRGRIMQGPPRVDQN